MEGHGDLWQKPRIQVQRCISVENGFRVFQLNDGTTIRYPVTYGRGNPRGGSEPTNRPLVR